MLGNLKGLNEKLENRRYQKTLEQMHINSMFSQHRNPLYYRVGVDEKNMPTYRQHNDGCPVSKQYFDIMSKFLYIYAKKREQLDIPERTWLSHRGLDPWTTISVVERLEREYWANYTGKLALIKKGIINENPEFKILPENLVECL